MNLYSSPQGFLAKDPKVTRFKDKVGISLAKRYNVNLFLEEYTNF